jgi:hypothetical protein
VHYHGFEQSGAAGASNVIAADVEVYDGSVFHEEWDHSDYALVAEGVSRED